ncbi:MAG: peptidoglycan-binding protein [Candidatus Paceibacterota bacterium]
MKKSIFVILFISSISFSFAASTPCLDFSTNLSRGSESNLVLSVQNFLFAKGFLRVTPNGYFGPSTLSAVKAYQKANGFAQVGNTGPATRGAMKRDSCTASLPTQPFVPVQTPVATTTPQAIVTPNYPKPVLDFIDPVTLFAGGETDWTFDLHGTFISSGNGVTFKNTGTGRSYFIGVFSSPDGKTLTLPKNLTSTLFSCGTNCTEKLSPGLYEVNVLIFTAGMSNTLTIEVKSFTSSVQTGSIQSALPASAQRVKFGSFTFSPSAPVLLKSVSLISGTTTIKATPYSNVSLVDLATNATYEADTSMSSFQSKMIEAYVDTNNTSPGGTIMSNFKVIIQDYIGKKDTTFISAPFLVTIDGIL